MSKKQHTNNTRNTDASCDETIRKNLIILNNFIVQMMFVILLQAVVISMFVVLCVVSFIGIIRIRDGLDITDILPRGTNEHSFLDTQSQYFGFYNFYAVTQVS